MVACAFCSIVSGDSPAHVVLDEGPVMAFLDRTPLFPGHVLVIPRQHIDVITKIPPELLVPLMTAVQRVASAVMTATDSPGTFVANNNVVSQSVPHVHVHVVPRRRGDGLRGFFWPRQRYEDDAHAATVAASIREHLAV